MTHGCTVREHDIVKLRVASPRERLSAGEIGTVVHVYPGGNAFEVEFVRMSGESAVVTLEAHQIERATKTGEDQWDTL